MSDVPNIRIPAGMRLVEDGNGGYEITGNKEPMTKTVAFRVAPSDYSILLNLVDTFPERSWGASIRWLLDHPDVRRIIHQRCTDAAKPAGQ